MALPISSLEFHFEIARLSEGSLLPRRTEDNLPGEMGQNYTSVLQKSELLHSIEISKLELQTANSQERINV